MVRLTDTRTGGSVKPKGFWQHVDALFVIGKGLPLPLRVALAVTIARIIRRNSKGVV